MRDLEHDGRHETRSHPSMAADPGAEVAEARARFRARFATEPRIFRAPGRINLIGEHTDYNDGLVLPMAIERAIVVAAAPRTDRAVHASSATQQNEIRIDLDEPGTPRRGDWSDYLEGVVRTLRAAGLRLSGADLHVGSTIPAGGGLSSSAALEVAVAQALLALSGEAMSRPDLARACQRAEHEWVGTRSGIMDQLCVLCAEADHALAIDCRSLETLSVPMPLDEDDVGVLITDSTVTHRLAGSDYNERRRECEEALRLLQRTVPSARALRDVTLADLAGAAGALPEALAARARHVVSEIGRVEAALRVLRARDWAGLGALMRLSHASLRDDFRVSTPELDLLVDTASGCSGVFGSRMTGGGFGGCIITLARRDALAAVEERLAKALYQGFGLQPRSFQSRPSAGAGEVSLQAEASE